MKKSLLSFSWISSTVLIWATLAPVAWGHHNPGYSHDGSLGYDKPNWMSRVSDSLRLSELSLPGTHDSLARHGGVLAQTQSMDLPTQLNSGIRVLDIRCRHISDKFAIHHGAIFQNAFFGTGAMEPVIDFLEDHPDETVLMRVSPEYTAANNTRSFEETFEWYMSLYGDHVWTPTSQNPTLGEVRGKIVILQAFATHPEGKYGLDYGGDALDPNCYRNRVAAFGHQCLFAKQDEFELGGIYDLYSKWLHVKNHLETSLDGDRDVFYINYLNGSSDGVAGVLDGALPFFVASGHEFPGTSEPRRRTSFDTLWFSDLFPDFPRVDCWESWCNIAFEGTNVLTYETMRARGRGFVGIVMADFPGPGLIDEIIHSNPQEWLPKWAEDFPQVTLHNGTDDNKCLDVDAAGTANGTRIQVWDCNQTPAQLWIEEQVEGKTVYHSALDFDKCLDLTGGHTGNGTPLQLYDCNYTDAQRWDFLTTQTTTIRSARDFRKCIEMADVGSAGNGTQVQIWDCHGYQQQTWVVEDRREPWSQQSSCDPALEDALGWNLPKYYETLKTPDIDGDGDADILARAACGLRVFRNDGGSWTQVSACEPAFVDGFWDQPKYYRTLRAPDIDGDGDADILIRSNTGIAIFRNDGGGSSWTHISNASPAWSDGNGWNQPKYYETLKTPDIDGDGDADLLARSACGIRVFRNDNGGSSWTPVSTCEPGFSDAAGWDQPKYYETLRTPDIDGDGDADLLARSACGIVVYRNDGGGSSWTKVSACNPYFPDSYWSDPKYYRTLRTPDIDGDGDADILIRSGTGIAVFRNDGGGSSWTHISNANPALTDADWSLPETYETLITEDIDNDGDADLLARSVCGLVTYRNDAGGQHWTRLGSCTPNVPFSDANGWTSADRYSTIQFSHGELFARDACGIKSWTPVP